MLTYRITLKTFSNALVAPGFAGRWNSDGRRVIYTAESIALAFLESMIRRQGAGFNDLYRIMILRIPDSMAVAILDETRLKNGWKSFRDYRLCQHLGDQWYDAMETPVLRVPSAVLPLSYNFVLNSLHPRFKEIEIADVIPLVPDDRLEAILKKEQAT